jgi:alanyl aminopeptidase
MSRALLLVVVVGCSSARPPDPRVTSPPAAVAATPMPMPTLRLPRTFTPVRYTARLALDPAQPTFAGEIAIEGTLDEAAWVIWLHGRGLEIEAARATDGAHEVELSVHEHGDLLEVHAARPLDPGRWTLELTYRGVVDQHGYAGAFMTRYGTDRYIASQFEAIAARQVFPCLDEPDRKAEWQLTLDLPRGLVATSNTMPVGTSALDAGHERVQFGMTRPISSYLVAFAVGPFEVIDAGTAKSGVPLRVVTPRGTAHKVAFLVGALSKIVTSLETWFGTPFPYPKLDVVIVPGMRGAMENVGMITTDAKVAMFDRPDPRDLYALVSTIGHETAHQWFGDLVTAKWWDDLWLNESFASWIEDKVLLAFDPSWPTQAITYRQRAFVADELASARRIHQPIETSDDILNAFDDITYPKGATVLRMIEHQMGETAFQTAIQRYLAAHADGNSTGANLFAALDAAGAPLGALATGWFEQPGVPEVAMELTCDSLGRSRLALTQRRYLPDLAAPRARSDETWTIPVCIAFDGAKHERLERCIVMAAAEAELELPICPTWFAPAGDYGYFHAQLGAGALEALRDHGWAQLTPDEHISIYDDAVTFARAGTPDFGLLASLAQRLSRGTKLEAAVALGDTTASGHGAVGIPADLESAIPQYLEAAARAKLRVMVGPLAKKYGLAARANEDQATAILRADLLPAVLWTRSPALDAEAKALLPHARALPADEMTTVLELAVDAAPALLDQVRRDLAQEHDPVNREALIHVLTGVRDHGRHRAMLEALIAEPSLTPDELAALWDSYRDEQGRADNEAYLREHIAEILARLPSSNDDAPLALETMHVFTDACDPRRRDEIAAFVTKHYAALPASARPIKQAIEEMDICIARKQRLERSVRAWLAGKP